MPTSLLRAAVLVLAASACSKPGSFASINPDAIDFGEIGVGESAEETIEICNVGDRDLAFELSLPSPFFFADLAADVSLIVAEGECADVVVFFYPDALGLQEGVMPLAFTDERNRVSGGLDVPIAGTGAEPDDGGTDGGTGGDGGTDGGDDTGDTDTGGTDTGEDTGEDTGADTGDTEVEDSPCPTWSGVNHLGLVRTYATTDLYEATYGASGTHTTWTESIDADGRALVWMDGLYETRTGGVLTELSSYTYLCDDSGMYLESYTLDTTYTSSGSNFKEREEHTYTDSRLFLTHDLGLSDDFEDDWASDIYTWSSLTGESNDTAFGTVAGTVTAAGSTSVPAGAFDTLEVSLTENGRAADTWHLESDLGLIASDYVELQSYE